MLSISGARSVQRCSSTARHLHAWHRTNRLGAERSSGPAPVDRRSLGGTRVGGRPTERHVRAPPTARRLKCSTSGRNLSRSTARTSSSASMPSARPRATISGFPRTLIQRPQTPRFSLMDLVNLSRELRRQQIACAPLIEALCALLQQRPQCGLVCIARRLPQLLAFLAGEVGCARPDRRPDDQGSRRPLAWPKARRRDVRFNETLGGARDI